MEAHDQPTQSTPADTPQEEPKRRAGGPALASQIKTLTPEPGEDVGEEQVAEQIQAETEAGFRGAKVDPTPNENYAASNSAVDNDLPTPETDQDLRDEARSARHVDGPSPL